MPDKKDAQDAKALEHQAQIKEQKKEGLDPRALEFQAKVKELKRDRIKNHFVGYCFTFPNSTETDIKTLKTTLEKFGLQLSCFNSYAKELTYQPIRAHFLENANSIEAFIKLALSQTNSEKWAEFKSSITKKLSSVLAEKIFFEFELIKTKESDVTLSPGFKKIIQEKLERLIKIFIKKNSFFEDMFMKREAGEIIDAAQQENIFFKETFFSSDIDKLIDHINSYSGTQENDHLKKVHFADQKISPLLTNSIFGKTSTKTPLLPSPENQNPSIEPR